GRQSMRDASFPRRDTLGPARPARALRLDLSQAPQSPRVQSLHLLRPSRPQAELHREVHAGRSRVREGAIMNEPFADIVAELSKAQETARAAGPEGEQAYARG